MKLSPVHAVWSEPDQEVLTGFPAAVPCTLLSNKNKNDECAKWKLTFHWKPIINIYFWVPKGFYLFLWDICFLHVYKFTRWNLFLYWRLFVFMHDFTKYRSSYFSISMGYCKKDVTPLLTHWSYIFLALTRLHSDVTALTHRFNLGLF